MAIQLACSDEILSTYLGISSPTNLQFDQMDMIRTGIESSIKKYCRWGLTETTYTSYLPLNPNVMGAHVPTAELYSNRYVPGGSRNRLQLPTMYVTSITNIWEDTEALAGYGASDFGSEELLVAGTDYFLEKDQGSSYSWSGGVIRVGRAWSSIPGTIKATYVSGFTNTDLQGAQNGLRLATIRECADHYVRLKRMQGAFITGVGTGADTTGLVSRERLGDYEVGFRDPLSESATKDDAGSYGLSMRLRDFLQDAGYVFMGVGV